MLLYGANSLLFFRLGLYSIGVLRFPWVPVLCGLMFLVLCFSYCILRWRFYRQMLFCSLSGMILPGTRLRLSSGAFSESSESLVVGFGWDRALYWMSSSGSLSWSQSNKISLRSAGCRSVA